MDEVSAKAIIAVGVGKSTV